MKKIIAHRGSPVSAHENTMDSFSYAIEYGADFIEFDVRRTKDNILVAHHDPFIIHDSEKHSLSDLEFEQLEKIANLQNFKVPRVEQILRTFCGRTGFDIELKEKNCEQEVLEMLSGLPAAADYFFTSFDPDILRKLKQINSSIKTGYLFENIACIINQTIDSADILCPDFNTYYSNRNYFSSTLKDYSYALWTVNTTEDLKRVFSDPCISAVITNDTAAAVSIRRSCSADRSE